jgi:NAD(P)-dependent dehydrogenase (short-subunit alcohol dehydrogenase family)
MAERDVAVITGASAGVGRAAAVSFAEAGFDVALLARGPAGSAAAAKEVERAGGRALVLPTDVASYGQVDEAAARVEEQLGPIDVWVNDAMTTVFAPSWDVRPSDFQRAVEVTFLGQVWGTMAALARMRPRDEGTIVNVGSALAFIGIPLQAPYCASKFACRGFFESVRSELLHEHSNVRISMVHLPAVNTPQFDWCEVTLSRHPQPVPPIYQPEVCARFILQAALDGRRAKVVGSWNKALVAAASALPGVANHYAAVGGWDSQLTDWPLDPGRQVNLRRPADEVADRGAHGAFDDRAGGFFDPSFLKSLPNVGRNLAVAVRETAREKARRWRGQMGRPAGGPAKGATSGRGERAGHRPAHGAAAPTPGATT